MLAGLENVGAREVVKWGGGPVETVRTTALGVDNAFRNALAVEVREQIYEMEILEQQRAVLAGALRLVGV